MIKLQAREIIREANRQGVSLRRGDRRYCAVGVVARNVGMSDQSGGYQIAEKLGVKGDNITALELGFEGYNNDGLAIQKHGYDVDMEFSERWITVQEADKLRKSRYFKVGQRIAELAGLPDRT